MEKKTLEVESTDNQQNPSSAVYGGSVTAVDSVEEDVQNQKKVVYRGWKVMPFIIGNANFFLSGKLFFFFLLGSWSLGKKTQKAVFVHTKKKTIVLLEQSLVRFSVLS